MNARRLLLFSVCAALLVPAGCKRMHRNSDEHVYVVSKQTFLRDRVAAVSNKVAPVTNGEELTVVEHGRRFLRVRTNSGQVGWLEEHAIIDQQTYDAFAQLREQHVHDPVVATGILRDEMYAHLTPGRESERFLLLPENDKLQLLMRASITRPTPEQIYAAAARKQAAKIAAEKQAQEARLGRPTPKPADKQAAKPTSTATNPTTAPAPAKAVLSAKKTGAKAAAPEAPAPIEDWWLVRDSAGRTGWLLARRIDVDIPDEVVRYAEGQKIVGAYLLAKVYDPDSPFPDHQAPEYVAVLNPYKDGLPYDFSMVRVFVWNAKKHRYEGGLRQKDLVGYLPVTVKEQNLDKVGAVKAGGEKAGPVPTFTLKLAVDGAQPSIDQTTGLIKPVQTFDVTYRLDGENVTRVQSPGEQAPTPASSASPEAQARQRERAKLRAAYKATHPHHRRKH